MALTHPFQVCYQNETWLARVQFTQGTSTLAPVFGTKCNGVPSRSARFKTILLYLSDGKGALSIKVSRLN